MSREEQIEEIYRILLDGCNGLDCYECEGNDKKDGCLHYHNANAIYDAGYRKTSEVAEEIFAEIEKILVRPESPTALFYHCSKHSYAELKKKYTEE